MVSLHFGNRVTNYMGWPLKLFGKIGLALEIVWPNKCSMLFSTLMFMPVDPAILTRNE